MKRAFKYEVAVSANEYDGLAVAELKRRLEHRLSKAIYSSPRAADRPLTAAATAAAHKVIESDARVVV